MGSVLRPQYFYNSQLAQLEKIIDVSNTLDRKKDNLKELIEIHVYPFIQVSLHKTLNEID